MEYECRYFWDKEITDPIHKLFEQASQVHPADVKLLADEIRRLNEIL